MLKCNVCGKDLEAAARITGDEQYVRHAHAFAHLRENMQVAWEKAETIIALLPTLDKHLPAVVEILREKAEDIKKLLSTEVTFTE